MSKVIPLRPGKSPVPAPPFLSPDDLELFAQVGNCLKLMFGFMNGARSAFEYAEQHGQISLSHVPGLIAHFEHVVAHKKPQTERGNLVMENNTNTELIPITRMEISGEKVQTVNLRHLHGRLGSGQEFTNWIKNRIEQYGFIDGLDFISFVTIGNGVFDNSVKNPAEEVFHKTMKNLSGGRPRTEYYATLGMAKELAMVERNEIGRKIRKYFIACEKQLMQMYRAEAIEGKRAGISAGLSLSKSLQNSGVDIYDLAKHCYFRRAGLTQKETGAALGISREKVQDIERRLKSVGVTFDYIPGNKRTKMAFDSFNNLFSNMDLTPAEG